MPYCRRCGPRPRPVAVDLCAGSGALAVAIAQEVPGPRVVAVERSPSALTWLRRNAAGQRDRDRRRPTSPTARAAGGAGRTVDAVVSNPPYVPPSTVVGAEVAHDPAEAVFAGPDGLALIPAVIAAGGRLLRPGGVLAIEHDDTQGEAAARAAPRERGVDGRSRPSRSHRPAALCHRHRVEPAAQGKISRVSFVFDCADPLVRDAALGGGGARPCDRANWSCCRPTPSTAWAPTPSTRPPSPICSPPRAAAATCRCRSWSVRGTRSTASSRSCPTPPGELIEAFWPGGLTIVVQHAPSLAWDLGDARGTVAIRMPQHPVALELLADDRADGGVERQHLRAAAGAHGRPRRVTSSATRSRSISTAARPWSGWPPRSSTLRPKCRGSCGPARSPSRRCARSCRISSAEHYAHARCIPVSSTR